MKNVLKRLLGSESDEKSSLVVSIVKKEYRLTLQVSRPLATLKGIAGFLQDRGVLVDKIELHCYRSGEAMILIHCHMEPDLAHPYISSLSQIDGVREIDTGTGR